MVVLLMGVSGSGKTVVGRRLAAVLGWLFVDGDDLHPEENIEKMSAGIPLTDADRRPWLQAIHELILTHEAQGTPVVIACSALREQYRRHLLKDTESVRLVYLSGDRELIARRLQQRQDHFFDASLLASQFAVLEEPTEAIVVSVAGDVEQVTAAVVSALGLKLDRASEEE